MICSKLFDRGCVIKRVKNTVLWTCVIEDLKGKETIEMF